MVNRPTSGKLCLPVTVVLLASALACGEARTTSSQLGTTTCTSCHDQPPPTGAHLEHVLGAGLGAPVGCTECHVVPSTIFAPGHIDDSVVTVTFGTLASKGGLTPSYNASSQTCSNVYCHGNFPFSKPTLPPPNPTWKGGSAVVACGTCHALPPPAPAHPDPVAFGVSLGCNGPSNNPALACHPGSYTLTSVDPKLHIDGRICPPFCTPATP